MNVENVNEFYRLTNEKDGKLAQGSNKTIT